MRNSFYACLFSTKFSYFYIFNEFALGIDDVLFSTTNLPLFGYLYVVVVWQGWWWVGKIVDKIMLWLELTLYYTLLMRYVPVAL